MDIKEKSCGNDELKQEEIKPESINEAQPPTDFKVAEIWIKNGQVFLEGTQEFWSDRARALGVLEFCKDIIKTAKVPSEEKPKIITGGLAPLDFIRQRIKGKK